jgi:hypothetical protein
MTQRRWVNATRKRELEKAKRILQEKLQKERMAAPH